MRGLNLTEYFIFAFMCGIVGCVVNELAWNFLPSLEDAVISLNKRGPDFQSVLKLSNSVGLGHARLSVIDTSSHANQPMQDISRRYTIVFNGEIFNYTELRETFLQGLLLRSDSDTEVLLNLFIRLGKDCLQYLNGFFAFAIYDSHTQEVFLARDRFGIKPLHIYQNGPIVIFASELKAILRFPIPKEIDYSTLLLYLQLNYLPDEHSMLKGIRRLLPGSYALVSPKGEISVKQYYNIPHLPGTIIHGKQMNYDESSRKLKSLVENAVARRLVSDVPLGSFLSGGIDSSIVTACAAKHSSNLNTFSIGYRDEPFYDETKYANLVAKKFKTNHTVFPISNEEMFANIFEILDYIDEPFADSSAIAVYILSKKTRQKVTVALSGDGGDELFAGYNKHKAEAMIRKGQVLNTLLKALGPLSSLLPKSRHSNLTNKFRQIERYTEGLQLNNAERYWRWCSLQNSSNAFKLLSNKNEDLIKQAEERAQKVKQMITDSGDLNDVLLADATMVLPGDMLTKVDLMSMANSLEVRVPLLDYTVVDFAFSLPVEYKLLKGNGKRILKDAFRDELPNELFTRSKHGFEVPLAKWIKGGLRSVLEGEFLSDEFIRQQSIFNVEEIQKLRRKSFSNHPNDSPALVWGIFVFQYWYKKHLLS